MNGQITPQEYAIMGEAINDSIIPRIKSGDIKKGRHLLQALSKATGVILENR